MADCLIGLGSNLGDRQANIETAIARLCAGPRIECTGVSAMHQTLPVGGPSDQAAFLNGALRVTTRLTPPQLLAAVSDVEQQLGRERRQRWGPRLIDVDILLYDQLVWQTTQLTIPHPRMAVRRFVLEPAAEVAAEMIHPTTGWSVEQLRRRLNEPPYYIAIAGVHAGQRRELAEQVADAHGAILLLDAPEDSPQTLAKSDRGLPDEETIILQRELTAVTRRAARLRSLSAPEGPASEAWILSDFWINQALSVSRLLTQEPGRRRLARAVAAAVGAVPMPKLVLLLDDEDPAVPDDGGREVSTLPPETEWPFRARLARELRQQAIQPGHGPVLRVPGSRPQLALMELVAAMDAMR